MANKAAPPANGRMLVAKESFSMTFDGIPHQFCQWETRVREGHPILKGIEHLFEPLHAHYDVEAASAAPGEVRGG